MTHLRPIAIWITGLLAVALPIVALRPVYAADAAQPANDPAEIPGIKDSLARMLSTLPSQSLLGMGGGTDCGDADGLFDAALKEALLRLKSPATAKFASLADSSLGCRKDGSWGVYSFVDS
jgi:hypothetical protein